MGPQRSPYQSQGGQKGQSQKGYGKGYGKDSWINAVDQYGPPHGSYGSHQVANMGNPMAPPALIYSLHVEDAATPPPAKSCAKASQFPPIRWMMPEAKASIRRSSTRDTSPKSR